VLGHTEIVGAPTRAAFVQLGQHAIEGGFATLFVRAVFAGWLIALMVWMLPGAETGRLAIIIIVTYLVGLGGFAHIVAGSVEVFYLATTGEVSWTHALGGWLIPVLLGNVCGGLALVAALNHAQVVAGQSRSG
jgi:formate-nitrite transporter family protein